MLRSLCRSFAVVLALALAGAAHADTRLVLKLRTDTAKSALTAKARIAKASLASGVPLSHVRSMALGADVVIAATDADVALSRLRANRDVEFVDVDRRRFPAQAIVNDEFLSGQKYLTNDPASISAFSAWQTTHGSAAVTVAVLDTGYRPHAAITGRFLAGYDMISDPGAAGDGNGRDDDASDPGDYVLPSEATA